jgi:hypothetical protein
LVSSCQFRALRLKDEIMTAPTTIDGIAMTDDTIDTVSKALRRAWQLGQTYWQQADSDSYKQQDKSDETQKKFEALVDETLALLSASKPAALTVWYGSMPESNGKTNWTAILHKGDIASGMTIDRSEYPDRVRYAADHVRWLIGELTEEPWILDYDADKHSGYVPPAAPAQSGEPVALQHVAVAEDGGKLRWMTGRKPRDCELYAMPDGGRAPKLYGAPQPSQPVEAGESFVKAVKSLAFLCRTETTRLDSETLTALDAVENHLVAMRASFRDADGELVNITAPSAVVLDDERAALEAWMQREWGYADDDTIGYKTAWEVWQARATWPNAAITDEQILDVFYADASIDACAATTVIAFARRLLELARAASPQATVYSLFSSSDRRNFGHLAPQEFVNAVIEAVRAQATATQPAQTAPYLPCPTCKGVEGCDHTVPERKRAAERPIYQNRVSGFEAAWRDVRKETFDECSALDTFETRIVYPAPQPVAQTERALTLDEYHEDYGFVVWWTWKDGEWLGEPAWIGTPNDSDWPGYHTHWTKHPAFPDRRAASKRR